jgi:tetratricopeptide (TPR) repeat protein
MINLKTLVLSLFTGAVLLANPALAIEVSEITVDFPLSEVLDIKAPESETTTQVSEGGTSAKVWRAPWEDDWYAYRQNVLRGHFSEAEKRLEKVLAHKKNRGIPNLYYPAAALLVEASSARKQGRYEDALKIIAYAKELAPDDPGPHFQRARTIWRQNQLRALSSLDALLEGWGTFFKDFRSFFPWGMGVILWLLVAMTISSLLTILLFTPRVIPRIAHDLSHIIKVPQWLWLTAIPIVLVAAVIFGLPVVVWVLLVALVMMLHLTNQERIAVGLALLFLSALPLLIHMLALSEAYYSDSRPYQIYVAERGGEGAKTLEELHQLRVKEPENSQIFSVLGVVLKRSGRIREAESYLLKAMEISPDSPSIINNLGNILVQTGRVDAAIDHYRQALRYEDDPRIHYNLSQALRENLQLEEGESEFRLAQEGAPELASSLMAQQQEDGQRVTVDIYGEVSLYLMDALSLDQEGRQWREALWSGIVPMVPFTLSWVLFPVSSVILFLGIPLSGRMNLSRRCRRCNKMHCHKCSQSSSDFLCAQCRQIFIVRSGVDPASRVKKMMQILRFTKTRALVSRVATVLLPGMGHISLGVGWQSLVLITVSVMFWTKWILWYGVFRNTTLLDIQAGLFSKVLFGILLGAFYLLALKNVSDRLEEN